MSDLNKALLRVAKTNPNFAELLRAELLKEAAGPKLKKPVRVEITPHGTFFAKERSLLKAERMSKKAIAKAIAGVYEGTDPKSISDSASSEIDQESYWMTLPKAMLDVIWADMHEGGA